jgi:hypothetical protein
MPQFRLIWILFFEDNRVPSFPSSTSGRLIRSRPFRPGSARQINGTLIRPAWLRNRIWPALPQSPCKSVYSNVFFLDNGEMCGVGFTVSQLGRKCAGNLIPLRYPACVRLPAGTVMRVFGDVFLT